MLEASDAISMHFAWYRIQPQLLAVCFNQHSSVACDTLSAQNVCSRANSILEHTHWARIKRNMQGIFATKGLMKCQKYGKVVFSVGSKCHAQHIYNTLKYHMND